MFNSLKKKFNTALQEASIITENLQQQYRQRVSTTDTVSGTSHDSLTASNLGLPCDVNVAAGCNLLAKYEDDWKAIHRNNVENSIKAQEVAEQIHKIETNMTNQHIVMKDLLHCLAGIPNLVDKLKTCRETLNEIQNLSQSVKIELDELENLCEECDLQEFILEKQCEISKYKQKRMDELELFRQKVANEHQQRIDDHEKSLRKIQRERQAVFDDAFRHDLEEFKQRGHLPSKSAFIIPILSEIHANFGQDVNLEEVNIDDTEGKDALEEFLNG